MARLKRFERSTLSLGGRCSIRAELQAQYLNSPISRRNLKRLCKLHLCKLRKSIRALRLDKFS